VIAHARRGTTARDQYCQAAGAAETSAPLVNSGARALLFLKLRRGRQIKTPAVRDQLGLSQGPNLQAQAPGVVGAHSLMFADPACRDCDERHSLC
jgi:hypothetical protein